MLTLNDLNGRTIAELIVYNPNTGESITVYDTVFHHRSGYSWVEHNDTAIELNVIGFQYTQYVVDGNETLVVYAEGG